MSCTSVLLPRAADAGHQAQHAQRKLDGDVLQIVAARAEQAIQPRLVGRRRCGNRDAAAAGQEFAGEAGIGLEHLGQRALKHDFAAAVARAGADLDDLIGRADHRFFVLDDDDRVAAVAQPADRARPADRTSRGCRPTDGSSST